MGSCQSTEAAISNSPQTAKSVGNKTLRKKTLSTENADHYSLGERSVGSGGDPISKSVNSVSSQRSGKRSSESRDGPGESGLSSKAALSHSSSFVGLDSMIENRKEDGDIATNVVRMEVPFGQKIEEVYDGVHTGRVLGSGISGVVRQVTHKATGQKYGKISV